MQRILSDPTDLAYPVDLPSLSGAQVSKKSLHPIVKVRINWLYLLMQTNKELARELSAEWNKYQQSAHPEDAMSFIEYAYSIGIWI